MISVTEATDIIVQHRLELSTEQVPLSQCIGRVLREDLIADRDFPPFDRVTMDGIAIDFFGVGAGKQEVRDSGRRTSRRSSSQVE